MRAAQEDMVGQIVDGKYRIERLLGRGGMGAVFCATHLGTSRTVALKVISPRFASEPEFLQRFQREAHACGRLRHPNIVDVTDFGVSDHKGARLAYLVMEYLDGCSLADVLRQEANLPLAWSIDVIEQVAAAIDEAHRHGILHRDLKPDNIWLEPNRRGGYTVKVLDFGLAKQAGGAPPPIAVAQDVAPAASEAVTLPRGEEPEITRIRPPDGPSEAYGGETTSPQSVLDGEATTMPRLVTPSALVTQTDEGATQAGAVVGTPAYMSPEQVQGRAVTAQSDVYSLGVIAYLMIGGRPPFTGTTDEVLVSQVKEPPRSILELRPDLPPDAAEHLMSALAKDPGMRPNSALAFAAKLAARFETPTAFLHGALQIFVAHLGAWLRLSILCFLPMLMLSVAFSTIVLLNAGGVLNLPRLSARSALLPMLASVALGALCFTALGGAIIPVAMQAVAAPLRPIALGFLLRSFAGRFRAWLREMAPLLAAGLGLVALVPFLLTVLFPMREALRPFLRTLWLPLRLALTLSIVVGLMSPLLGIAYFAIRRLGGAKAFQFLGAVMLVEGLTGEAARQRSAALFDQAGRALQPIQILIMVVAGFCGFLAGIASNLSEQLGSIAIVVTLLAVTSPFLSLVAALTYLRARRAAGEPLDQVLADFERSALPEGAWQLAHRDRVRQQISMTR